jgi:hypothetical protein
VEHGVRVLIKVIRKIIFHLPLNDRSSQLEYGTSMDRPGNIKYGCLWQFNICSQILQNKDGDE